MMAKDSATPLTDYPPTSARKSLSPSQLATLYQTISSCLASAISLPPAKRDTPASRSFVASYAQDTAILHLQLLIWASNNELSKIEIAIRQRVLILTEKLVISSPGLELQTLLDLAIIYSPLRPSQMRHIIETAIQTTPALITTIRNELIPAFSLLLGESVGLYGVRKAAYCIKAFIRAAPPDVLKEFGTKEFLLSVAKCYDQVLSTLARSYGGLSTLQTPENREADDWERIWIETKVDLLDAFHDIISRMLHDLSGASGRALSVAAERTFDSVFALLDIHHESSSTNTPFLDRILLADYQQSYDLSQTLASALRHAKEKDSRLDLLESSLKSLEEGSSGQKNPGVLKLIIKSSGFPPGTDNMGRGGKVKEKGKSKAMPLVQVPTTDIDLKVSQVLDIFPEYSPLYISALLSHPSYPFHSDAEKLIEALLEGTAPLEENLQVPAPIERHNVFDDEVIDVSKLHIGKKRDEIAVLRDRTFMEQMKADILRRAEAISDDEEEEDEDYARGIVAFDDEADLHAVKVSGDGEGSGGDEDNEEDEPQLLTPDIILELAYIRDPKLFDRDMTTRRGKGRADLKAQTGWTDEQIEGWRIMLERNPKKEKILQKHEFAGNQISLVVGEPGSSRGGQSGRGRGGGGRARGQGRGGAGTGGSESRDRAFKDRNKASRGNHNRKRGHDKKMARAGPPPI